MARFLPPEWHPQQATLLAWPHDAAIWGKSFPDVQETFVRIISALLQHQPVMLLTHGDRCPEPLLALADHPGLLRVPVATNDIWIRDYGPLATLSEDGVTWIDARFDGWGGKFTADLDDGATAALARLLRLSNKPGDSWSHVVPCAVEPLPLVIEGGNLECDGAGTLLSNGDCLFDPARNKPAGRHEMAHALPLALGCQRILTVSGVTLLGDDTDGHIDNLARFVGPDTLVYTDACGADRAQGLALERLGPQLEALRTPEGDPYRLQALPLPKPRYREDGARLPASYANFLIANRQVLVPCFADPSDDQAMDVLATCFPDRQIVGIDARTLISQGGALHCASMQLPAPSQ